MDFRAHHLRQDSISVSLHEDAGFILANWQEINADLLMERHEADVTSSWDLLFSKLFTKVSRFLPEENGPGMCYDMTHPPHSSSFPLSFLLAVVV